MLSTLRRRFILSHILPLLITLPLMGIALIYVLGTQVLLSSLSRELRGQVTLVVDVVHREPSVWTDPAQAQSFANDLAQHLSARVMLLDPGEHLLASSDLADASQIGTRLNLPEWNSIVAGQTIVRTTYSQSLNADIVDAFAPVIGPNQQVLGVVRLSHQQVTVLQQFLRLRYLIAAVLLGGLLLGAVAGWVLAVNLEHPLSQATEAVRRLASGEPLGPLPERGPEEILDLIHSVNTLVLRLQSAEEARRQLLANLVHELGRPLGALRSAIYALLGGAEEDARLRQDLLVGMNQEIGHLRRLLDDLAGLHQQAFGSLELNLDPTALGEWLTQLLPPWRESALSKGLQWKAEVPPDLPTLPVDADRLAQALGNLLSNAIKYTPINGTVTVRAGTDTEQFWIRVSDTGPGIEPDDLERIFAPFYRREAGRRFQQGMGLGLGIARDLVAAHGGWLNVESTPGQGSTFILSLPLQPEEQKTANE
jgi:two-component system sensor histidine kinase BaeS